MPSTWAHLCSELSVSQELLFVLLTEAGEPWGQWGRQGPGKLGTLFFTTVPRQEETEQFPASAKLPLPVQKARPQLLPGA